MMKTLLRAGGYALLGGAVVALVQWFAPAPRVHVGDSMELAKLSRRLEQLDRNVEYLSQTVAELRSRPSVAKIEAIEPARIEVGAAQTNEVKDLVARIDKVEGDVASLVAATQNPFAALQGQEPPNLRQVSVSADVMRELNDALAAVDETNAAALVNLAQWASDHGLLTDSKRLLRMAVKADPDNPVARERLGYQKYDGKWMTAREVQRQKSGE